MSFETAIPERVAENTPSESYLTQRLAETGASADWKAAANGVQKYTGSSTGTATTT